MAKCKNCIHCTKMEIESIELSDGIIGSYWLCFCGIDGTWEDDNDLPCGIYAEDKTRIHE